MLIDDDLFIEVLLENKSLDEHKRKKIIKYINNLSIKNEPYTIMKDIKKSDLNYLSDSVLVFLYNLNCKLFAIRYFNS